MYSNSLLKSRWRDAVAIQFARWRDAVATSAYASKWFFQANVEAGRCSAWRWAGLASAAG